MKKVNEYCLTFFQPESNDSLFFSSSEKPERIEAIIGIIENEAKSTLKGSFITNKSFLNILKDEIDLKELDNVSDKHSLFFLERKYLGRKYSFMYDYLNQNFSNIYTETLDVAELNIDCITDKVLDSESIKFHYSNY